jgi:hypothetical protein
MTDSDPHEGAGDEDVADAFRVRLPLFRIELNVAGCDLTASLFSTDCHSTGRTAATVLQGLYARGSIDAILPGDILQVHLALIHAVVEQQSEQIQTHHQPDAT